METITEELGKKIDDALEQLVNDYVDELLYENLSENVSDNFSDTAYVFKAALEREGICLDEEDFQKIKAAKERLIIDLVNKKS